MRRHLFGVLSLLLLGPAAAGAIVFDPPRVYENDRFEILIRSVSPTTPPPGAPYLRLAPGKITVELMRLPGILTAISNYGERVPVDGMPAGTYDVVLRTANEVLEQSTLVVHPKPFTVAPAFGALGTEVLIEGASRCESDPCTVKVRFGGEEADAVRFTGSGGIAAHAPSVSGAVDVELEIDGVTETLAGGYVGIGSAGHPDLALMEKVLLPLNFRGQGAPGADWRTETIVRNDASIGVPTEPLIFISDLAGPRPIPPRVHAPFPEEHVEGGVYLFGATCSSATSPGRAARKSGPRGTSISRITAEVSWEYSVVVRIAGAEVARRTLVVRDRPFRITPDTAAPGEKVLIEGVGVDAVCPLIHCAFLSVFFGAVEAESVEEIGDQQLLVTVPQGSGRVDVRVELRYGDPVTFPGGFTYDFHDTESDRVVVPLNFAGPGAQGSQWTTDLRLRNDGPVGVDVLPPLFPSLPPTQAIEPYIPAGGRVQFETTGRDGGAFLHATRGLEKQLTYVSHVRDLSRSTTDLGAEMPLVRAEDTARTIRLLDVPVETRYRARLRVYNYDDGNGREVAVTILSRQGAVLVTTDVTLSGFEDCFDPPCLAERPAFAVLDLDQIPALRGHNLVDITLDSWTGDGRIWAFVSVTNNETQAVTLYTPQHRTRAQ
jgi:hypothetical protein